MNLKQLVKLLQWLNETETVRQSESDRLTLDNDNNINDNNIVMSESDNTDSDDFDLDLDSHNSDENQLWNEESLKNYTLNVLNLLKSFYSTFSEISSVLFTAVIYWVSNKFDKDSHHNINFESWKAVFTAERLVQLQKIQWTHH